MNSRNILTQSKNHQAISRHTRSSGISDFPLSFPVTEVAAELSTGVVLRAGSPDSQREWTQLSTVCRSVRFAVQTRQTHGETDCAAARTAAVSASKLKINSRTPVIRKCSTGCFSGRVYIAEFQPGEQFGRKFECPARPPSVNRAVHRVCENISRAPAIISSRRLNPGRGDLIKKLFGHEFQTRRWNFAIAPLLRGNIYIYICFSFFVRGSFIFAVIVRLRAPRGAGIFTGLWLIGKKYLSSR